MNGTHMNDGVLVSIHCEYIHLHHERNTINSIHLLAHALSPKLGYVLNHYRHKINNPFM